MQTPSNQQSGSPLETALNTLAGQWILDPHRSTVQVRSKVFWGAIPVTGFFHEVTGRGTVSPGGDVNGTVTVAAASIDTKNARRDKHLRSADFFDCAAYPVITFTVESVRAQGERVTVSGALTVRDRTRSVSFDAAAFVRGDDEIRVDAQVDINRADFGMTWNQLGAVGLNNTITIHAVFSRQSHAAMDDVI